MTTERDLQHVIHYSKFSIKWGDDRVCFWRIKAFDGQRFSDYQLRMCKFLGDCTRMMFSTIMDALDCIWFEIYDALFPSHEINAIRKILYPPRNHPPGSYCYGQSKKIFDKFIMTLTMTLETKQIGYLGYRWPVTFYTQPTYPCLFLFHATSDMAYATLDLSLYSFIKRSVLAVNDRFMFVSISVNSGKFKRDISKLKIWLPQHAFVFSFISKRTKLYRNHPTSKRVARESNRHRRD